MDCGAHAEFKPAVLFISVGKVVAAVEFDNSCGIISGIIGSLVRGFVVAFGCEMMFSSVGSLAAEE